jgi:hypothetical protein
VSVGDVCGRCVVRDLDVAVEPECFRTVRVQGSNAYVTAVRVDGQEGPVVSLAGRVWGLALSSVASDFYIEIRIKSASGWSFSI